MASQLRLILTGMGRRSGSPSCLKMRREWRLERRPPRSFAPSSRPCVDDVEAASWKARETDWERKTFTSQLYPPVRNSSDSTVISVPP